LFTFILLRSTNFYIKVALQNEIYEQTGKEFSQDYINTTKKETSNTHRKNDAGIDFIIQLIMDRGVFLRL